MSALQVPNPAFDLERYVAKRRMKADLSHRPLMRADLLKCIYSTMLLRMKEPEILEFWRRFPLHLEDRTLKEEDLLGYIWDGNQRAPKEYVAMVMGCLEYFLVHHGHDAQEFVDGLVFRANNGTPVPPRVLLKWIFNYLEIVMSGLLETLSLAPDRYLIVLQFMKGTTEDFIPGSRRENLNPSKEGGQGTVYCLFAPDADLNVKWTWFSDLFGLKMLANAPRAMGLPPFDDIFNVADTGCLEYVLWDEELRIAGGKAYINGEEYGSVRGFHDYCREWRLDLSQLDPPDWRVIEMTRPYWCKRRNREVLHAGCAYGAPVWIARIRYPVPAPAGTGYPDVLIREATLDGHDNSLDPENLHAKLMARIPAVARFQYLAGPEIMILNGKRLLKGVPAMLLDYMIRDYRTSKRTRFSLEELKGNTDLCKRTKSPNLEKRLIDVAKALEKRSSKVRLEKERGFRILVATCEVEYSSDESRPSDTRTGKQAEVFVS